MSTYNELFVIMNEYQFGTVVLTEIWLQDNKSSVIRQKGESENGCFKKTKHAKFSEKRTFLTP